MFDVWNDCTVYMAVWQLSSDPDLIFMVQSSLYDYFFFLDIICNRSTMFKACNDCKVYMSVWDGSLTNNKFSWFSLYFTDTMCKCNIKCLE